MEYEINESILDKLDFKIKNKILERIALSRTSPNVNVSPDIFDNIVPTERCVVDTYLYKFRIGYEFWLFDRSVEELKERMLDIAEKLDINQRFVDKFGRDYRVIHSIIDYDDNAGRNEKLTLVHRFMTLNNVLEQDKKDEIRMWYLKVMQEFDVYLKLHKEEFYYIDERDFPAMRREGITIYDIREGAPGTEKYKTLIRINLEEQKREPLTLIDTVSITEKSVDAERKKRRW